jgi:hypothetical protein
LAKIIAQDHEIYFFGGGKSEVELLSQWESQIPNATSLAGKLSLKQELQKIAKLELMISMDSANMHLASLVGTRCISIWGAVIGGKYGNWKLKNEPDSDDTVNINLYFDEEFDDTKEIGKKEQGTEIWSGKGDFTLTDFSKLTKFLSSLMSANEIHTWSKNAK